MEGLSTPAGLHLRENDNVSLMSIWGADGKSLGALDGISEVAFEGDGEGTAEGLAVGRGEGNDVGVTLGVALGVLVGHCVPPFPLPFPLSFPLPFPLEGGATSIQVGGGTVGDGVGST